MSRGPGRRQRAILDALARPGVHGVIVTEPDETHSEQVALRRAAYRLADLGLIKLISQRLPGGRRLVAYKPDYPIPSVTLTHGLDGKFYRRPMG